MLDLVYVCDARPSEARALLSHACMAYDALRRMKATSFSVHICILHDPVGSRSLMTTASVLTTPTGHPTAKELFDFCKSHYEGAPSIHFHQDSGYLVPEHLLTVLQSEGYKPKLVIEDATADVHQTEGFFAPKGIVSFLLQCSSKKQLSISYAKEEYASIRNHSNLLQL
jgi:hypothetical protein